jgi:hypothetical protein
MRKHFLIQSLGLTIVGLCTLIASARADSNKPAKTTPSGPCAADIQKFCEDVPAGGGRIRECLDRHSLDLSDSCEKYRDDLRKNPTFQNACREDEEAYCFDVRGDKKKCLKAHMHDLSLNCQAKLQTREIK